MKKSLLFVFILLIIFIVTCQKAPKQDVMEKKGDVMEKVPAVTTTGEAVVDAVGDDLTNVNNVEKDLSSDELSDLDAGLTDVQNI